VVRVVVIVVLDNLTDVELSCVPRLAAKQGPLILSDSLAPNLKFSPHEVDTRAGELRKQGSKIRLQEKPLRVLAALAAQPGMLVTRYAARGDKQKARETLETLLNLWKDADPDLPLLKKAKTEYAKLQSLTATLPRDAAILVQPWRESKQFRGDRILQPLEFIAER
jgi:hypothetical protein